MNIKNIFLKFLTKLKSKNENIEGENNNQSEPKTEDVKIDVKK